jgi:putative YhbY family RNA-binding protein
MPALTSARRSELRAKAHDLAPVVMIGDKGLTASVIAEVERALRAHELIKVKAVTDDREARVAWMAEICAHLGAENIQLIGKMLVLWRANPDKAPKPEKAPPKSAPKPKKKASASVRQRKTPRTAEELIRIARRQSRTPSPPQAPSPLRRRPRTSR